jgi:hypothetical protein
MSQRDSLNQLHERTESTIRRKRHPVTREHSPEETIERMRSLPERAAKLKEVLRALREAHSR